MTQLTPAPINLDTEVRKVVYDSFISRCLSILQADIAKQIDIPLSQVAASLHRLAEAHMLVLQPSSGEVLMANPFSAVPTAFRVEAREKAWWANCIWDGLGVCAMVGEDAVVTTSCPDCGEALSLEVSGGKIASSQGIIHFAVPAAHWWDDIVFT
jgi:hypothetical protein